MPRSTLFEVRLLDVVVAAGLTPFHQHRNITRITGDISGQYSICRFSLLPCFSKWKEISLIQKLKIELRNESQPEIELPRFDDETRLRVRDS